MVNMAVDAKAVLSFSAGREHYAELIENEGVIPAPYMARIHWVALERWDALDARQLATCLGDAHALTLAKLPKRTREALALPAAERRKLIEERSKLLAARKANQNAIKAAQKSEAKASKKSLKAPTVKATTSKRQTDALKPSAAKAPAR